MIDTKYWEDYYERWDRVVRMARSALVKTEKKRIEWIRRIYKDGAWISPSRVFAL